MFNARTNDDVGDSKAFIHNLRTERTSTNWRSVVDYFQPGYFSSLSPLESTLDPVRAFRSKTLVEGSNMSDLTKALVGYSIRRHGEVRNKFANAIKDAAYL